jgi:hypothetical protein
VILRTLIQNGSLRRVDPHSKQFICVSTAAPKKVEVAEATKGGKQTKQPKGKKGEEPIA